MNYIILYLLLIGSLFCDPIVTIKKTTYIENDFYKEGIKGMKSNINFFSKS